MRRINRGAPSDGATGLNAPAERRGGWPVVIAACLCATTGSFDLTATNVVLNSLTATFDVTPAIVQWINLAFLLPLAGLAIPFGRWLDTVGRRGPAVLLTLGFAASSVLAATATGFGWLIAARLLQGFFAAGIFPLMNVLTYQATEREQRARVAAVYATSVAMGAILGPSLGALLAATIGWRSIFALSVPLLLVAGGLFQLRLPSDAPLRLPAFRLILEGVVLLTGVSLGLFALTGITTYGIWWLGLGLLSIPVLAVWLMWERKSPTRVLLNSSDFRRALARLGLHSAAGMSIQVLLAFQAQRVFGFSLGETGGSLVLVAVGGLLASALLSAVGHRWPASWLMFSGFSLMAAAGLIGAAWDSPNLIGFGALATVVGIGQGLARSSAMLAALQLAPSSSLGVAGGAISLSRNIGYTAGPAMVAMIWGLFGYSDGGLRCALLAGAGFALMGVWLSVSRTTRP